MRKTIKLISVLLIAVMAFSFTGCFFKATNPDEFKKALTDVMGAGDADYIVAKYDSGNTPITGCTDVITYFGSGVSCTYYQFSDSKAAYNFFDKYYQNFEDVFENNSFRGDYQKSESGSRGYVYMDGTIGAEVAATSMFGTGPSYGGAYYEGNVVTVVITHSDSSAERLAAEFLKATGYPSI